MNCDKTNISGSVTVIFRLDDSSAISSLQLETDYVNTFAYYGVQSTIGVTPFIDGNSLPQKKAKFYFETHVKGLSEIALHGNNHQLWDRKKINGEFSGLSFAKQLDKISTAKHEMEQVLSSSVSTFIPPWNAYDHYTVKILKDVGMNCLSGSLRGPFVCSPNMFYLPATCLLGEIHELVRLSFMFKSINPIIVVLLHDFDFVESGNKNSWINIDTLRNIIIFLLKKDVKIKSINQVLSDEEILMPERFIPYQQWLKIYNILPGTLKYFLGGQVYWSKNRSKFYFGSVFYRQILVSLARIYKKIQNKRLNTH